jgi:hypothetical protein
MICIGGPKAGEDIEYKGEFFEIAITPDIKYFLLEEASSVLYFKTFRYKNFGNNLLIPEDWSENQILEELIHTYRMAFVEGFL